MLPFVLKGREIYRNILIYLYMHLKVFRRIYKTLVLAGEGRKNGKDE